MTIREFVKRRLLLGLGTVFSCFLIMGILGITFGAHEEKPSALFLLILIPFFIVIIFVNFGIRCPKCNGNLGITIGHALFSPFTKHKPHYCPFCGISLDEDSSLTRKEKQP